MKKRTIIIIVIIIVITGASAILFSTVTAGNTVTRHLNLGNRYLGDGKYSEAILSFEKVIQIDPNNIPARMGLAKAYIETDRPESAKERLREVVEIDDKYIDAYIMLSEIYIIQNDTNEAIRILEEAYRKTGKKLILELLNKLLPDAPAASIDSGIYSESLWVELMTFYEGWRIYYTIDESAPDTDSIMYGSPISIKEGRTVIKTICVSPEGVTSGMSVFVYEVYPASEPVKTVQETKQHVSSETSVQTQTETTAEQTTVKPSEETAVETTVIQTTHATTQAATAQTTTVQTTTVPQTMPWVLDPFHTKIHKMDTISANQNIYYITSDLIPEQYKSDGNIKLYEPGAIGITSSKTHVVLKYSDDTIKTLTSTSWSDREIMRSVLDQYIDSGYMGNLVYANAGDGYTYFINDKGELWAYGKNNTFGALGTGDTEQYEMPVKIMDNVVKVVAGRGPAYQASYALQADGTLWGWGHSDTLGPDEHPTSYHPVKMYENVKNIEVGYHSVAVILTDGTLIGWGRNFNSLFDMNKITRSIIDTDVTDMAFNNTTFPDLFYIKKDGTLYYSKHGSRTKPVALATGVLAVAGNNYLICIMDDYSLWYFTTTQGSVQLIGPDPGILMFFD